MIKLILKDVNKKKHVLTNTFDLSLNFHFKSQFCWPYATLETSLNLAKNVKFKKIKLYFSNYFVFDGDVENQVIYKTSAGLKTKIIAKSQSNVLCNLKAEPISYNNVSLKNILDKYIFPYGFLLAETSFGDLDFCSTSLENFTILPDTSHWDVLKFFLKKSMASFPFAVDNKIMISNFYIDSDIIISNQINKRTDNFFENKNLNYFNYLEMFANFKNTNHDQDENFELFVLLPGLLPAHIGQKILIKDNLINDNFKNCNNIFVIKKLDYVFKNNELMTYLYSSPNLDQNLNSDKTQKIILNN